MKRLVRRTLSGLPSAIGFGGLALAFNLLSAQDQACGVPFFQPQIQTCAARLDWAIGRRKPSDLHGRSGSPGSCEALRTHIERFPEGAYHDKAADMLAARRITKMEIWIPSTRQLSLFTGQDDNPSKNKAVAQDRALLMPKLRQNAYAKASWQRHHSASSRPNPLYRIGIAAQALVVSHVVLKARRSARWRSGALRKRRAAGVSVRGHPLWILAVVWCVARCAIAHGATAAVAEIDARAEIAAALFAASATQAAAERVAENSVRIDCRP